MEQYGYWIVTSVVGLMIAALAFFMKRTLAEIEQKIVRSDTDNKERFEALEKRVDKQDSRFEKLLESLPQKYALRDDLIRMSQGLEGRLDKIQDLLMDIKRGGT